jgi:hypothetical protein
VTNFGEKAALEASVGVRSEGRFAHSSWRHVPPMESRRSERLAAVRPPYATSDEPHEPEVAIARATTHLILAYELLEALDWRAACLATLPRFGDLDCAIRSIHLALIVLADEEGEHDHSTTPFP